MGEVLLNHGFHGWARMAGRGMGRSMRRCIRVVRDIRGLLRWLEPGGEVRGWARCFEPRISRMGTDGWGGPAFVCFVYFVVPMSR